MWECQLFDMARLREISEIEQNAYESYLRTAFALNQKPPESLLPAELQEEKDRLLKEGHKKWTRSAFKYFTVLCTKFGRTAYGRISSAFKSQYGMDYSPEEVKAYSKRFWEVGEKFIPFFDKYVAKIEKGEQVLNAVAESMAAVEAKYKSYKNPWEQMVLSYGNSSLTLSLKSNSYKWTHMNDVALICALCEKGYGNWSAIAKYVKQRDSLDAALDYFLQTRSVDEIKRRCKTLMQIVQRDEQDRIKREKKRKAAEERRKPDWEKKEIKRRKKEEDKLKREAERDARRAAKQAEWKSVLRTDAKL